MMLVAVFGGSAGTEAKKHKRKKKKPVERCASFGQQCASDASCCDQTGKVICEIVRMTMRTRLAAREEISAVDSRAFRAQLTAIAVDTCAACRRPLARLA